MLLCIYAFGGVGVGITFKTRWKGIRRKDVIGHLNSMRTILHEAELFQIDDHGEHIYRGKYLIIKHYHTDGKHYYEIYKRIKDPKKGVEGWDELAIAEWDPTTEKWHYTNKKANSSWYEKFLTLWSYEKGWLITNPPKEVTT